MRASPLRMPLQGSPVSWNLKWRSSVMDSMFQVAFGVGRHGADILFCLPYRLSGSPCQG
ncbi:hypothetical protein [Eikenella sp. NML03-A-027]|uniref:hypothetical protein n=1 Tax=Eikenella sp. NML03-A-027 TaxID=1795828 RepID=UPI0012E74E89|nr:hypothetical protein [Eikenella sp. NML03-A-027]